MWLLYSSVVSSSISSHNSSISCPTGTSPFGCMSRSRAGGSNTSSSSSLSSSNGWMSPSGNSNMSYKASSSMPVLGGSSGSGSDDGLSTSLHYLLVYHQDPSTRRRYSASLQLRAQDQVILLQAAEPLFSGLVALQGWLSGLQS